MTITLKRGDDSTIGEFEAASLHEAVEANKAKLVGAKLVGAKLVGAYLGGANLAGADLGRANLGRANLGRASHDIIAEILRRDSGEDCHKRAVAGLVLISRDWCWDRF